MPETVSAMKKRHAFEVKKARDQMKKEMDRFSAKEKAGKRAAKAAGEARLAELSEKHAAELAEAGVEEKASVEEEVVPAFSYDEGRLSKAAKKRREREEREERALQQRAAAAAAAGPSKGDRETATLSAKVASLGYRIVAIAPDGNCLYASIAHALQNAAAATHNVASLRTLAADYMRAHSDDFAPFLVDTSVADYATTVESTATWGGELELRALASALPAHFVVHQADAANPHQVDPAAGEAVADAPTVHLAYTRSQFSLGEHYSALVPV